MYHKVTVWQQAIHKMGAQLKVQFVSLVEVNRGPFPATTGIWVGWSLGQWVTVLLAKSQVNVYKLRSPQEDSETLNKGYV